MSESWSLGGLELNDGTLLRIVGDVNLTPPKSRAEWISGADSRFGALTRSNPLHENREITLPLEVVPQGSIDPAFDVIGQIRDKLREASASPDGISLTWSPDGSTRTMTFDVLEGEVTGLPLDQLYDISDMPRPELTLRCKPYGRGPEVLSGTFAGSIPVISGTIEVGGDVPALGRMIVTDTASQTRNDVEWGYEGPDTYTASGTLILDSDNLVTSGFSGSGSTRSGAYDPNASGNSVIRQSTVSTEPSAICGTGAQAHVGTYRAWARCYIPSGTTATVYVRLAWRVGDAQYNRNTWAVSPLDSNGGWTELDLGTITVPPVLAGAQQWDGRIEAMASTGTVTVDVDYVSLIPTTDGYGRARGTFTYTAPAVTGYDDFESLASGTVLNGRSATTGGTWATSGATTDFAGVIVSSNHLVQRSTNADSGNRYAILGSTSYTNTAVRVGTSVSASPSTGDIQRGAVARWVDSSNYLSFAYWNSSVGSCTARLTITVGGTATEQQATLPPLGNVVLRLIAYASGLAIGQVLNEYGSLLAQIQVYSSQLATGGTLATGKPGFFDRSTAGGSIVRYYDPFSSGTPTGDPSVLFSGQSMEIRHDDVIREDSGGTFYGQVRPYRGTRFYVPPGIGRWALAARRADRDVAPATNVTDATNVQFGITPQYLVIPRA